MIWGQSPFRYRVVEGWGLGLDGRDHSGMITGVAVDSEDRLYAFRRAPHPGVLIYDREGPWLSSWGEHIFAEPHAIWVAATGRVYCTDREDHTVRCFTATGTLLSTLGTPHQVGAPGMPFHGPAKAVTSPDGDLWVADGYGQARIHHLDPEGQLLHSWGRPGSRPGELHLPHSLIVDPHGRLIVGDRENHRLQLFDTRGLMLDIWSGLHQPMDICLDREGHLYVAEVAQCISILSMSGQLLARWGESGPGPGQFASFLHGICVDSRGDLYVADESRLQKFARVW